MDRELPDDLKLSQVDVDHEQRSFCCEYEIGAGYETVRAHLEEYLFMKELAERALLDVGSVPEDIRSGSCFRVAHSRTESFSVIWWMRIPRRKHRERYPEAVI